VKSKELKTLQKLLHLVRHYVKSDTFKENIVVEPLAYLATQHQVRSVVYALIPTLLKKFTQQSAMVHLGNLRQLFAITDALENHQIPYFLHKGIHYGSFYQQITHREVGDIDIVVKSPDLLKTQKILLDIGYERWQSSKSEFSIGGDYHWQFIPTNTTVGLSWVEVHWSHSAAWEQIKLPIDSVFENIQQKSIAGRMISVPSPDDLILLLTIHHGAKERWRKLKYLLDLTLIVTHYEDILDWKNIWQKANQSNLTNYLTLGLILIQEHLETNLPECLTDEITKNTKVYRIAQNYENVWDNVEPARFGTIRNLLFALRIQSNGWLRFTIIKDLSWTIIQDYLKNIHASLKKLA
jgi:hypothetical protein